MSDPHMVALLIKHRNEIYPHDTLSQSFSFKELLTCIYIDLDRLIDDCKLSPSERVVVKNLISGYTLQDIASEKNIDEESVAHLLNRAALKIADLNNRRWLEFVNGKYRNCPLYTLDC